METLEKFLEEINNSFRTELENTITKLKKETEELYGLIDKLEYNLALARQALSDNNEEYFSLRGKHLEFHHDEGARRNCIAGDYVFQSINDIKAVMDKLNNKEGKS